MLSPLLSRHWSVSHRPESLKLLVGETPTREREAVLEFFIITDLENHNNLRSIHNYCCMLSPLLCSAFRFLRLNSDISILPKR